MRNFLIILAIIISAIVCSPKKRQAEKIDVVVSILPLAEFAEKIGGEKIRVSVMVLPGASPHTYEPTPSQLVNLTKANMYVKVGTPIEFELVWLDKILSVNKNIYIVDASAGLKFESIDYQHSHGNLEEHNEKGVEPHVWLSVKNAKIMVKNIYKGLVFIDSVHKNYYTAQKEAYLKELDKLDIEIEQLLTRKKNRKFMVYHPAWSYFAKDYDLEQIAIEIEGKEPTAKDIQNLIEKAKKHNVKVIFASPQFNTESAEVIAREIGGRVVLIDALDKNYLINMKKVANALAEAME